MAHTLTLTGIGSLTVKVNGNTVLFPYTLKDGDVITISSSGAPLFEVNGTFYDHSATLALEDVDIAIVKVHRQTFDGFTVTINYSESGGGGSMLDVTYNGSKIIDSEEVTPPVTVTYNGSTIATLNAGDTKTLDILGSDNKPKILATPIVIGSKTIPDVDALGRKWVLEHNLEVEVGGGGNTNLS